MTMNVNHALHHIVVESHVFSSELSQPEGFTTKGLARQSRNQRRKAGFTAEAQVVRKNRNLEFGVVLARQRFSQL